MRAQRRVDGLSIDVTFFEDHSNSLRKTKTLRKKQFFKASKKTNPIHLHLKTIPSKTFDF